MPSLVYVLRRLRTIMDEEYELPTKYNSTSKFLYRSMRRSAMAEILHHYMYHNNNRNSIAVIEEFRKMMDDKACEAKTAMSKTMYSIYYDVATDVLDMVLSWRDDE